MTTLVAGRVRSLPFLRALYTRDVRLLWGSEAVSVVGDQFHFVALFDAPAVRPRTGSDPVPGR